MANFNFFNKGEEEAVDDRKFDFFNIGGYAGENYAPDVHVKGIVAEPHDQNNNDNIGIFVGNNENNVQERGLPLLMFLDNRKYKIVNEIGKGGFGIIWKGVIVENGVEVAIKGEEEQVVDPTLPNEAKLLKKIGIHQGYPRLYGYFTESGKRFMVMDLLGESLEKLKEKRSAFSAATVMMIGTQMMDLIEYFHSLGLVHCDIKPANILLGGKPSNRNELHLIDYGLSKPYWDPMTNCHVLYREHRSFVGTALFASINAHAGIEQSRRDDLESIGYLLVYLSHPNGLPWKGLQAENRLQRYEMIAKLKLKVGIDLLCSELPSEMAMYMKYVRNLSFDQKPDYKYLASLFQSGLKKVVSNSKDSNLSTPLKFDWDLDIAESNFNFSNDNNNNNVKASNNYLNYNVNIMKGQPQQQQQQQQQQALNNNNVTQSRPMSIPISMPPSLSITQTGYQQQQQYQPIHIMQPWHG